MSSNVVEQEASYCSVHPNDFPCDVNAFGVVSMGVISGVVALCMVVYLVRRVRSAPRGNEIMNRISDQIQSGAKAFLRTEYKYMLIYIVVVTVLLLAVYSAKPPSGDREDGLRYAAAFLVGACLSASSGWRGMMVATDANVRTTQAATDAEQGLSSAMRVAFTGGAVMGFTVVGQGLLGLSVLYFLITLGYASSSTVANNEFVAAADAIAAFGFGASSIALFARVAGGIYTKAADIGADLVGKIEMDIPEDDLRNPAVIADNVGDNVGDVAGMGADLFESYVGAIIATIVLAEGDTALVLLPIWVSATGILASMLGFFAVSVRGDADQRDLMRALHQGILVASVGTIVLSGLVIWLVFKGREAEGRRLFACVVIGIVVGVITGGGTEYFTSYSYPPVRSIVDAARTGPATVIIQGLGVGMLSSVIPVIFLTISTLGCSALAGTYGVSIAAVGMLSTLGVTLATDAFGPIADNAGGIAEMAKLDASVRHRTDALDALGNTTAATGKGFAIGSAVLTALSLLEAFTTRAGLGDVSIQNDIVLAGVLLGAMLPFLFASLTMLSVQKTAAAMIDEVHRQFSEIPGLKEGTSEAEPNRCIAIAAHSSVEEMLLPGFYAVISPFLVGFLVGPRCLTGMVVGAIVSGMMLALMMANAGGAWDNAKKYVENEGAGGGKGKDIHKACVVGDTVGDPFKDTSGPSLNILIKLMSIISLTIAPLMRNKGDWENWYYGLIPLVLTVIVTQVLVFTRYRNVGSGNPSETMRLTGAKATEVV